MAVSILLVCAVLASLSAGVLLAYALCLLIFRAFRIHAVRVAAARRPVTISTALES